MAFDILILTDHDHHTEENSVYTLAAALAEHSEVNSVDIASRGVSENAVFFNGNVDAVMSVIPALPQLTFSKALLLFESASTEAEIIDYDFILLRLPHPFPEALFCALPEVIPADHIINTPAGIARTGSKAFLLEVADLCPPLREVKSVSEVMDFLSDHPLILKPANSYGGMDVVKLTSDRAEYPTGKHMTHEMFFRQWQPPKLAMQFLKNVADGEKRTLVVSGKILGSVLRKPNPGSWMCNVAQGASFLHAIPDTDEIRIAERLIREMQAWGIVIFSFDTLTNDEGRRMLSDINTMSAIGLKQTRDAKGHPVIDEIVSCLIGHMHDVWYGSELVSVQ